MAVPEWRVVGDWFDVCKCNVPCPCTFAEAPTTGDCEGILAWHIREGHFGDVRLDGLNVVAIGGFEGNVWEGAKASMGIFLDDRADDGQREALQAIFGGHAGGWPGEFAAVIGEVRGLETAPIEFEIADDLTWWRVEVPGKASGRAEALTGPTTLPGQLVQTHNPPGAECGPGSIATWGRATADEAKAFGFDFDWAGKSSKHMAFDWSGPS
jgi:hypothetical protein